MGHSPLFDDEETEMQAADGFLREESARRENRALLFRHTQFEMSLRIALEIDAVDLFENAPFDEPL